MSNYLQGKISLPEYSHQPDKVKAMEEAGTIIMDIITASRSSKDLRSWVKHFRDQNWPIFAALYEGKQGVVKLWCKRVAFDE